jgi:hypothetical protein
MKAALKEEIRYELQCVFNSCREGEYGYWEPNKEGFAAMAEGIESIAKLMGLTLKEMYNPPSEESEEQESQSDYVCMTWSLDGWEGNEHEVFNNYADKYGADKATILENIYYLTGTIGMNSITNENYETFFERLACLKIISNHGFIKKITLEDVKHLIGLKTNATVLNKEEFNEFLKKQSLLKGITVVKC